MSSDIRLFVWADDKSRGKVYVHSTLLDVCCWMYVVDDKNISARARLYLVPVGLEYRVQDL